MDAYNQLADRIEKVHYDLLQEVDTDDLPKGREAYYTLGNFVETIPEDQARGYNQYYIWMRVDHKEYKDPEVRVVSLAHEYGHFLCRTMLYPNLLGIGKYILNKLSSRKPYQRANSKMINFITVVEELTAWVLGWCVLFKMGSLKWSHFSYGFKCWKSYWYRVKP